MRFPVFACAALLISALLSAQNPSQSATNVARKHRLDQQVSAWLKEFNVTSASVAYIDGGKIAFTAYYAVLYPNPVYLNTLQ